MQKRASNRRAGFGAVEILVAVIIVLVVGFIGWRLYDASKSKQANSTEQTATHTPADTAKYLDVKELGVKIKLDDQIKDTTYSVQTLDDGSLVAHFSTQALAATDPACDAKSSQLGALQKSKTDTDRFGNRLVPDGQTIFKIGDYYFTYAVSQALCSESARSAVSAAGASFRESLKTLQVDQ